MTMLIYGVTTPDNHGQPCKELGCQYSKITAERDALQRNQDNLLDRLLRFENPSEPSQEWWAKQTNLYQGEIETLRLEAEVQRFTTERDRKARK